MIPIRVWFSFEAIKTGLQRRFFIIFRNFFARENAGLCYEILRVRKHLVVKSLKL